MPPYATPKDLADRWRVLTEAETAQAETLLGDAAVWLRAWFPDLDARIESGQIDQRIAVMVSCAMVKRAMLGLDNSGQESSSRSETMGPFNAQHQIKFRNPDGDLYVTNRESDMLEGRASGAVSMECVGM